LQRKAAVVEGRKAAVAAVRLGQMQVSVQLAIADKPAVCCLLLPPAGHHLTDCLFIG